MFKTIKNALKTPDVRKRLLYKKSGFKRNCK
jgi:hypothetical protein